MITIHPQYLTLSKLLDGRLFRIPEYQRAYSWTARQRQDLFGDIEKAYSKGPDEGHFMAAVVCLRRDKQTLGTDEYDVVEVVDGQQRLTTLIILLNAIKLALDQKNKGEAKLARELEELLVKVEGDELLLLQTNHDSSHHFATFLRKGSCKPSTSAKTIADREILKAIEDCKAFVTKWTADAENPLPALAALLKNRLFFLLHEIADEKSVYTVFEVLNSRGLVVSWLDRLKSILMGAAFELKHTNHQGLVADLHTIWRDIYSVIGLRQGLNTEALRFAATLRVRETPNRPLSEEDSVTELRSGAFSAKQIRDLAHWLFRVTQACDTVTANPRLNAVTRISQARLLATAIHLREDITEKERDALLVRWEKVSFRIYGMLGNDARTRVGDYVRLAWRVINENLSVKSIDKAIGEIGGEFKVADAVEKLRNVNCYEGWQSELRYLMFRYEEHLARNQKLNFSNEQWEKIWLVTPAESIEHIWANSKAPEKSKHRLGNLVLLPPNLNSTLQDDAPKDKTAAYRKTGLLIAGEVADIIDADGWTAKSIDNREAVLLEWAANEWAD
jgi:Protein of unknown function DUF262/Protein of unknown function (DUF1524)